MSKPSGKNKNDRKAMMAGINPEPICPECGKAGSHFVPPSMGEDGFFACKTMTAPMPKPWAIVKLPNRRVAVGLNPKSDHPLALVFETLLTKELTAESIEHPLRINQHSKLKRSKLGKKGIKFTSLTISKEAGIALYNALGCQLRRL